MTAPACCGALFQFVGRAIGDDLAAIDDDRARTSGLDFFENVGRENDRLRFAHLANQSSHFMFLIGIEAVGRLIHNQNLGIVNDRLRETGPMPITFRQRLNALMDELVRENTSRSRDRPRVASLRRATRAILPRIQKSQNRHLRIRRRVFGQVTDETFCRYRVVQHVKTADGNFPLGRRNKARNHPHGGGFTGSVRTEESQHFALFNGERNTVYGGDSAK